jgi:hypothetical protein
MPKYFHFHTPEFNFNAPLVSKQCEYLFPDGHRCRKKCQIGLPMCRPHLRKFYNVDVRPSTIPNAGLGVFAYDKTKGEREIVFKKNETIIPYASEYLPDGEDVIQQRYENYTAPYAIEITEGNLEDGALHRGIGSLVNHKPQSQANCRLTYTNTRPRRAQIKADKNIRNNSELFVSYGSQYRFNEPGVSTATNTLKYNV